MGGDVCGLEISVASVLEKCRQTRHARGQVTLEKLFLLGTPRFGSGLLYMSWTAGIQLGGVYLLRLFLALFFGGRMSWVLQITCNAQGSMTGEKAFNLGSFRRDPQIGSS